MGGLEVYTADGRRKIDVPAGGGAHPDLAEHDTLGLATQTELDAHVNDAADAHDASAISIADAGGYFNSTEMEAAMQELGALSDPTVLGGGAYRQSLIEGTQFWRDEDFFGHANGSSDVGLSTTSSGTGSAAPTKIASLANHPGIFQGTAGTTNNATTGFTTGLTAIIHNAAGAVRLGWVIRTPSNLSDDPSGCTYDLKVGFFDGSNGIGTQDSCVFYYTHSNNSGKWEAMARSSGTNQVADTGIAVAANTWYYLEINIVADNSAAEFYIDHTLVATITSSEVPETLLPCAQLRKTAAHATTRTMAFDYMYMMQFLSR